MKDVLHPLCLIIAGTGFLILVRDLAGNTARDRRDPALLALTASFLASAASFAVSITWVWIRVDKALGVPNIVVPIAQGLVVLVLALQGVVIAHWSKRREQARRRATVLLVAAAAVIAGMALLFMLLTPASQRPTDFANYYAHDPAYQAYVLLYFGTYSAAEIYLAWSCWRYSRTAATRSIALGLRLVAVGAAITLVYSGIRIAAIIGAEVGFSVAHLNDLAWACGDIGATLTQFGYFLPVIASRCAAAYASLRDHYAYARLTPLWQALTEADPSLALEEPVDPRTSWRRRQSIRYPLIRRRMEIRDGMQMLRPFLAADVRSASEARHAATKKQAAHLAAAVTADQIAQALVLHRQGRRAVAEPAEYADAALDLATVRAEQRHLLRVAASFTPPPQERPPAPSASSTSSGART
ncbi:MAB_1171c family putative transporter [Streptomyces sp. NPDC001941]|uniref:MAB_1171c family putative transporter n=1 Tax=Streptomyces sp. NPDC001941 TaxID=3154659 RepID=UPI0033259FF2